MPDLRQPDASPAGVARRTAGYRAARAERAAFDGLPASFRGKNDILAAIAKAGAARPVGSGPMLTLMILFSHTPNTAWQAGHEPIVWLGTAELAGMVGSTSPTIERHLMELENAGLIERRYPKGRRVISLAPAAAVAQALQTVNHEARQRRQELARQTHELGEIATDLAGLRLDAERTGRPAEERARLAALEADARTARAELRAVRRLDGAAGPLRQAEHGRVVLRRLEGARSAWRAALALVASDPIESAEIRTQARKNADLNLTIESLTDSGIQPWQELKGAQGPEAKGNRPPYWHRSGLRLSDEELTALSAHYRTMRTVFDGPLDSSTLALIGQNACAKAGVRRELWQDACDRHGSTKAALAALAALEMPPELIRGRSRGAVLVGMLRKPTEDLNPVASLWGYRARRRKASDKPGDQKWLL
ncbi:helix-turn-helix domain-containing protein [Marinivivus vitaminiproducens]|uniref:helix-turn-helix domain-containing protein n=1 Tax=Marinivivus vitaminiproducens TaxID=3035935 RepID=UPI00279D35A4|nr:helix-turn-helix domain-containing protein [Geminicoccaceae bacterium SCSIO 64248]